jgi:hypothetical protein
MVGLGREVDGDAGGVVHSRFNMERERERKRSSPRGGADSLLNWWRRK